MGMFSTILPSSPVGSTYAGMPMDMDDWECEDWKQYYLRNKYALGKEQAVSIVNKDSYRIGIFANAHYCPYDCDFATFMANEGLDPSNIFSSIYCGATKVTKNVVNATVDTSEVISNVTGAVRAGTSSKFLTLLLIGGLGYVAYNKFVK